MAGSSQYRFGVLAKIVRHMRLRHLDGDDHPLTLEDILDETNQLDIGQSVKTVSHSTKKMTFFPIKTKNRCPIIVLFLHLYSGCKQKHFKIIQKLMCPMTKCGFHSNQCSS